VQELREEKWTRVLSAFMKAAGKSPDDALKTPKSAAWKIEAARALRQSTTASNAWIAAHLVMGHPSRVCNLIRKRRRLLTRKFPATHGSKIMGTTLHPSCVTTLANRLFGM
jgi:hypothetical protein